MDTMKNRLLIALLSMILIATPMWAIDKNTSKQLSNAEKMDYSRTNRYWGPNTFYCYAPGKVINKMADNSLSHMRDLTGISREDTYTELKKQGFTEIPRTKKTTWYKNYKGMKETYFLAPDKSYILRPTYEDLYMSPTKPNGEYMYATNYIERYVLIPKEDSEKVIEAIWQFLRELRELKVGLGTFGSNFKKANPKAYPSERVMSGSWTGFQAGTWVLANVKGKIQGFWQNNEEILRRTIAEPEFHFVANGYETDFDYALFVDLTKEGYVLNYAVICVPLHNLVPGQTWQIEYPKRVTEIKNAFKSNTDAIATYKTAPFPPTLHDLDKLLHIK
jgi:hypothetical protein